jgi:hypothetical protein
MRPTKGERFLEAFTDIDDKFLKEAMNYTMKKRFNFKPIIAIAACAALALAAVPVVNHFVNTPGVENPDENKIGAKGIITAFYAGGSADSSSGIAFEKETDFDGIDENFLDKTKVGTKQTVTIAGKTYTGTYVNSTKSDYYEEDTDNYSVYVDGALTEFFVNKKTGIVTGFYVNKHTNDSEKKLTRDECYAKAIECLKLCVDDIENYTLIDTFDQGEILGYLFRFYRMVNGIKTSDCINIRVTHQGEIGRYSLYSIGEMKNVDISAINMENIDTAISDKIDELYKNCQYKKHSIENMMFARLANGKYAFVCDVYVKGSHEGKAFANLDKIVVEVE